MSPKSDKSGNREHDDNLISLKEWERLNSPGENNSSGFSETPRIQRIDEGVIKRLKEEDDESLNEESLGVGLAAMIQLGEALINATSDTLKRIKIQLNDKINSCLKSLNLRQ